MKDAVIVNEDKAKVNSRIVAILWDLDACDATRLEVKPRL